MQDERGGVVSAIRIHDRIIYSNEASLGCRAPRSPPSRQGRPPGGPRLEQPGHENAPADQINGMRDERRALSASVIDSKAGADKMWGNGRKIVRK